LLVVAYNIKQRHLPCHGIFLFLADLIQYLQIDDHKLLSGPSQTVKGPGLDKAFYGPLVDLFSGKPLDKILQVLKFSASFPLLNDGLDHRTPDTLDRRQAIADLSSVYGEVSHTLIDVRGQDLDSHLAAGINIF